MAAADVAVAKDVGVLGFEYNRANYRFDQQLRWQRFTVGRQMAIAQTQMFREDVEDLANVATAKLKVYAPILTMALGYCVTIFVEGRSGLKFPAPPTFLSGIYLQCLGVAFGFMMLGTWLVFHSAIRAQIMAVQLRTRKVRLPVPSQRQLDSARKCLSAFEEQNPYDMFRLPFVLPQAGNSPDPSDDDDDVDGPVKSEKKYPKTTDSLKANASKGKKRSGSAPPSSSGPSAGIRMPGLSKGAPSWMQKEMKFRENNPKISPSAHGKEGPVEPYEHFEWVRQAQKEYWSAEAYTRVCFLFGFMHLIHSFGYWLVIHNIAELGMVWGANVCGALLTAAVWLLFRLDVLPEHGGCLPIEASGPFVSAIAMGLLYSGNPTIAAIDCGRILAALVLIMQILWTVRLYMVAMPGNSEYHHEAKENGGGLFNESGSCSRPSWLPSAFQHVTYLIAPPKTKEQLAQEEKDREHNLDNDPVTEVDMTPWRYTRVMLIVTLVGWGILLAGRIVEGVMGERMLVTNPGAPPWTRTGQWYGWEFGPISSKHYAHVTPQRGHFSWQKGWGPQGQQELWASDVFGFAPEADAWWAEEEGPEPHVGAAGIGENTWYTGMIRYGTGGELHETHPNYGESKHDWLSSGGHRRLHSIQGPSMVRSLVPAAVQWPMMFEPELLACGPSSMGSPVAAFTTNGLGALVPAEAAAGRMAGIAKEFTLGGLLGLGMARGMTWGLENIWVVTGSGSIATCPLANHQLGKSHCSPIEAPQLPFGLTSGAVMDTAMGAPLRVVVSAKGMPLKIFELSETGKPKWDDLGELPFPFDETMEQQPEVVAVTATHSHLVVTASDGVAYQWEMRNGLPAPEFLREAPAAQSDRMWRSACTLPTGKIMRLASNWRRSVGGGLTWHPELLI